MRKLLRKVKQSTGWRVVRRACARWAEADGVLSKNPDDIEVGPVRRLNWPRAEATAMMAQ